tara:strand:- start:384 stop:539 length:156 start_codon:yes stop_codon:yes gene_type:complete
MLLMKVVALLAENVDGQNVTKFSRIKSVINKKGPSKLDLFYLRFLKGFLYF